LTGRFLRKRSRINLFRRLQLLAARKAVNAAQDMAMIETAPLFAAENLSKLS
jgi:hypothetical protein